MQASEIASSWLISLYYMYYRLVNCGYAAELVAKDIIQKWLLLIN